MANIFHPHKADYLPSKKHYLLRAGFKGVQNELDRTMLNLTNEIYLEAIPLVEAQIAHQTIAVENVGKIKIPMKFKGINRITYFVSTIGKKIEERIERYSHFGETTKAVLLDAWGSEALEELNENFDKFLRKKHHKGTMRFSPGYSDLNLSENKKIIDLLRCHIVSAHPISGMLSPQKSTVCMIGWY
ncbi:MAG: methionine synthase [Thermotogota bacterium]|nr:methionine synthase [Thermotogota bacterium]